MIDVGERGLAERAQRLVADHQHVLAHYLFDLDAGDIELAIRRLVRTERKQRRVVIGRDGGRRDGGVHGFDPYWQPKTTIEIQKEQSNFNFLVWLYFVKHPYAEELYFFRSK